MNQTNSDGSSPDLPIVFVDGAFEWLRDMLLAGVKLAGVAILGAVGIGFFAFGLYRAGLI